MHGIRRPGYQVVGIPTPYMQRWRGEESGVGVLSEIEEGEFSEGGREARGRVRSRGLPTQGRERRREGQGGGERGEEGERGADAGHMKRQETDVGG